MLKVSIITVCYNSEKYIECAIQSVVTQTYSQIEYIVIDGGSTDNTTSIIEKYKKHIDYYLSEPDKGIYNAMNKGLTVATGDVVGILNSDDYFFSSDIIETLANNFKEGIQAVYGDVQFVDPKKQDKVVRYYSSAGFSPRKFKFGFMPAHPSFYARRDLFLKYGLYKEDYKIAADFELVMRFLNNKKINSYYIKRIFVNMRVGGTSNESVYSRVLLNREIIRACKENGVKTNFLFVYAKYIIKIFELVTWKTRNE